MPAMSASWGTLMSVDYYNLARGLHIIAAIAWLAGLLMLPRFYAYIAGSQPGGELETAMLKAARSLQRIILLPAFILTWVFGLWLLSFQSGFASADQPWPARLGSVQLWLWGKIFSVLLLSGYHGFLSAEGRRIAQGQRRLPERFWRLMSEVPFLVAIVAILLVTIEP
jgi:putative membrane protein